MLLVSLKRCAFYTQMRQFATLRTRGRIEMNHLIAFKYTKLLNSNLSLQRLYNTDLNNQNQQKTYTLPHLMWQSTKPFLPFVQLWSAYLWIRGNIDKNFRLLELNKGVKQAIVVISKALADQDYEALDGIVKERTLKLLKHKVGRLTPEQRKLIAIHSSLMFFIAGDTKIREQKEPNETTIQIEVWGMYLLNTPLYAQTTHSLLNTDVGFFMYQFQQKYRDGVGGGWIARIVNHFVR